MVDFQFFTAGPGPVMLRAITPAAQIERESGWIEGPATARRICADLMEIGFVCEVDGAAVELVGVPHV